MDRRAFIGTLTGGLLATPLATDAQSGYKSEFKMSVVVNEETAWGRAAIRFADALRSRTAGRIQVKPYFNGRLFADEQTTEFRLLQQGGADFAIGSTINWSPQVKELNLFAMPFSSPTTALSMRCRRANPAHACSSWSSTRASCQSPGERTVSGS